MISSGAVGSARGHEEPHEGQLIILPSGFLEPRHRAVTHVLCEEREERGRPGGGDSCLDVIIITHETGEPLLH